MPSKHTPGPWSWEHRERFVGLPIFAGDDRSRQVAIVDVTNADIGVARADARLIAATPDLLKEHKALIGRVREMSKALRRKGLGGWVDEWLSDGVLSGEAIAKAGGSDAD